METKITYRLLDENLNSIPENEVFSDTDLDLIDNYQVNKRFDLKENFIEGHVYSLSNELLFSDYNLDIPINLDEARDQSASSVYFNPSDFTKEAGFEFSDVKVVFHFLNDLYSFTKEPIQFYIEDISQDRTELLLYSEDVDVNSLINNTEDLKDRLSNQSYFDEFYLNLGDNDLLIGTNIDVFEKEDKFTIAVKLYEPLSKKYNKKSIVQVVEKVSDSVAVRVDVTIVEPEEQTPKLRSANFNIDLDQDVPTPTEYFNYNELFSYNVENSNNKIFSYLNEKSVNININHDNYENFIHFSSAEERLKNFKYKFELIESYQSSIDSLLNSSSTSRISATSNHYKDLIKGVVENFDHYESFLYYESSSAAWPKSNTTKPYTNYGSTTTEATTWYNNQLISASNYDTSNYDVLTNTIPSFLAEDTNNNSALLFVLMLGQHFDNLWVYTKAVTDKYDNDNRLDFGISKDLVRETLQSFGTKIYNSTEGKNDLFRYLIADTYDSGSVSEVVNNFIQVPNISTDEQPISRQNYEGELYKRLYHNLPYLLKTKGTERGLRALINCFGIPSDFLTIKQYGGAIIGSSKFVGFEGESTGSAGKVRFETRASGSVGKVLTQDKSIQKTESDRTQDIHRLEVGFSPSDSINEFILSQLPSSFSVDDYIGDPRNLHKGEYFDLMKEAHRVLHNSTERTQLNDFIRILKFYDNVLFKMVKDFIPAKATLDTGIIIKPHILNRSKVKSPELFGSRPEYSGSIDTAFIEGGSAGGYEIGGINIPIELDIEAKWKPGRVGGISNFSFQPDYSNPTATNPGEIIIWGTEFYPPNGEAVTFEDRYMTVYTPYEGTFSQRLDFYLMYTSESVTDRFNINTGFDRQHPNIIAVDYFENDDTWRARDNSSSTTVTFTPLDTDVIIAAASLTATNTLGYFINFTKPLLTKRPGEKSTLHRLDIKTKQGSTVKWVEDEAPKINGELSGSIIEVTDGELNKPNIFKQVNVPFISYDIIARDAGSGADYTVFTLSSVNSTVSAENACLNINSFTTRYHNGTGNLPAIGDFVFDGINDATGKNGGGNWWLARDNSGATYALAISGSDNFGFVGNVIPCSNFDNVPPSGYTATWAMIPQTITAANSGSVPFTIYDAEVGATYAATASLQGAPGNKVYKTGTVTGTGTTTTFSNTINCTNLADGQNVYLDVTLTDAAGNKGGFAPVGTNFGNTLTASIKDTRVPTGYSADFKTSFSGTTSETNNTSGNFYIRVSNLPSSDTGTIYYSLTSTGGGSTYSNSTGYNTSFANYRSIYVSYSQHSLNNGTVTFSGYAVDSAGNQGPTVTDTVLYNKISGTMSLFSGYDTELPYWAQTVYFSVNVTPNSTSWYIEEDESWMSISGASGYGDDSSVTLSVSGNTGVGSNGQGTPRLGAIHLKSSLSDNTLDSLYFSQDGYNCVAPHTLILMSDGSLKKAIDLEIGDVVKTKHQTTLEDIVAPVTQRKLYRNKRVKLKIGEKELICSDTHRLYVDNRELFIPANELVEGDILSGKEFISREEYQEGDVVKITIEEAGTYISEGILSHNFK